MADWSDDVSVSTPPAWWLSRAIMLGTAGVAGISIWDAYAKNQISVNPMRTSLAERIARTSFNPKVRADKTAELFKSGRATAFHRINRLSPEQQTRLAEMASVRFGETVGHLPQPNDIAVRFAGTTRKKAFWAGLLKSKDLTSYLSSTANDLLATKVSGNFIPALDLPGFNMPVKVNPLKLDLSKPELAEILIGSKFGSNEADAKATIQAAQELAQKLGSNETLIELQNTSEGAVASSLDFKYSHQGKLRSLKIPLAHESGLVYQGVNRSNVGRVLRENVVHDVLRGTFKGNLPEAAIPAHVAAMEHISQSIGTNGVEFSAIQGARQEALSNFIYEGHEYHSTPELASPVGLPGELRSTRHYMGINYSENRQWSMEEMQRFAEQATRITGQNVVGKANTLAKGVVHFGFNPYAYSSVGMGSESLFQLARGRRAIGPHMLMEAYQSSNIGVPTGRFFLNPSETIRTVPYVTTPMQERLAKSGGQQVIRMRTYIADQDVLSRAWSLLDDPKLFGQMPVNEEVLFSQRALGGLGFSTAEPYSLGKVSPELAEQLGVEVQGRTLTNWLSKEGGLRDLTKAWMEEWHQNDIPGFTEAGWMGALEKQLTVHRGMVLGENTTGLIRAGAKGSRGLITSLVANKGLADLTVEEVEHFQNSVKFFGETVKATGRAAEQQLHQTAFAVEVSKFLDDSLVKAGLSPQEIAGLSGQDRKSILKSVYGLDANNNGFTFERLKPDASGNLKQLPFAGDRVIVSRLEEETAEKIGLAVKARKGGLSFRKSKHSSPRTMAINYYAGPAGMEEAHRIQGLPDHIGKMLAGKEFSVPGFQVWNAIKQRTAGVVAITPGGFKNILGKESPEFFEALTEEVGRKLYSPHYGSYRDERGAKLVERAIRSMERGGFRSYTPNYTKLSESVVSPELINPYVGDIPKALARKQIKVDPRLAVLGAASHLGILDNETVKMLHIGGIGEQSHMRTLLKHMAPGLDVPEGGERAAINKLLADKVRNQPWSIRATFGELASAYGAGNRGTMSNRAINELSMIVPEEVISRIYKDTDLSKFHSVLTATQVWQGTGKPGIKMDKLGKVIPLDTRHENLLRTGWFGVNNPETRLGTLESLGMKEGDFGLFELAKPKAYEYELAGKKYAGELTHLPFATYDMAQIGRYVSETGEVLDKPMEGALRHLFGAATGTSYTPEHLGQAMKHLHNVVNQQGENLSKAFGGPLHGSKRLYASRWGEDWLEREGIITKAQWEGMTIIREDALTQALADGGEIGGSVHEQEKFLEKLEGERWHRAIKRFKGRTEEIQFPGFFLREPAVIATRVQATEIATAEELALAREIKLYVNNKQHREKINREARNKGISPRQYLTNGAQKHSNSLHVNAVAGAWNISSASTAADTDMDTLTVKVMMSNGEIGAQATGRAASDYIKAMTAYHGELTEKLGTIPNKIDFIYGLANKSKAAGMSEWAYHQFTINAIAGLYNPILKPTKPVFSAETWSNIRKGLGLPGLNPDALQRLDQLIVERLAEKKSIGILSNAVQGAHRMLGEDMVKGRIGAEDFHAVVMNNLLIEEALALKARHGAGADRLALARKMGETLINSGANPEKELEFYKKAMGSLFEDQGDEIAKFIERGAPHVLNAAARFNDTERSAMKRAIESGDVDSLTRMLQHLDPGEPLVEAIRSAQGNIDNMSMRAGRVASNLGETVKDVYSALGKNKGLLIGGAGAAVGIGLLFGGHGQIAGSDDEQIRDAAMAHSRGSTPLPSSPSVKTVKVTPGMYPSVNVGAQTEGGAWNTVANSIGQSLQGQGNTTIVTNVKDYRRDLIPDYIFDEMQK